MNTETNKYMDHTHPDAFLDMTKLEPCHQLRLTTECPTCKGHGRWNLVLNDYPWCPNPIDRHFKQMCGTCYGHGYVDSRHRVCEHAWVRTKTIGRSLHVAECTKCGQTIEIDSGD